MSPEMANNDRYPRFELHILPLVRLLDREKMLVLTGLDLWDYDTVKKKSPEIHNRIQKDMPLIVYGGLWPKEWVDLFKRWMDTGFKKLELGAPSFPYQASRAETQVTLIGATVVPDESFESWLHSSVLEGDSREYALYWQEPDVPPVPPLNAKEVVFEETFVAPASLGYVLVRDVNGQHRIPIEGEMSPVARELRERARQY